MFSPLQITTHTSTERIDRVVAQNTFYIIIINLCFEFGPKTYLGNVE